MTLPIATDQENMKIDVKITDHNTPLLVRKGAMKQMGMKQVQSSKGHPEVNS